MADGPALFRACREALGLTAAGVAAALHVGSGRTVRKWEAGDRAIPGPVWVALCYMLRERGDDELAAEIHRVLGWPTRPLPLRRGASLSARR